MVWETVRMSCCQVFSLAHSDMGDGLILVSKHSNWTSLMIHMYYETDVDEDDNYSYQMLFDNTCILSIGCKPMMLSTLIWLKLDIMWLKLVVVGLWVFTSWSLCMSRSLTAWSCRVSLAERSRSSFTFNYCVQVPLPLYLPAMPLTTVNGKSRLWVLEPVTGVQLSKKVFTSRARWILLWGECSIFWSIFYFSIL
jgi:hypothetical protein